MGSQSIPLIINSDTAASEIVGYIDSFFGSYNLYTDEIAAVLQPREINLDKKESKKETE